MTIAVTGDTLVGESFLTDGAAPSSPVGAVLRQASLAVTNLDQPLRQFDDPVGLSTRPRWPSGGAGLATELRELGFTAVTLANDHTADDRGDGVERTRQLLADAGLWTAGGGVDLATASGAATIGAAPRRVAPVSVATSVTPGQRATPRRGDVAGRPGVSALRYSATVTADPPTFAALAGLAQAMNPGSESATASPTLTLSGTVSTRGARTRVDLEPEGQESPRCSRPSGPCDSRPTS